MARRSRWRAGRGWLRADAVDDVADVVPFVIVDELHAGHVGGLVGVTGAAGVHDAAAYTNAGGDLDGRAVAKREPEHVYRSDLEGKPGFDRHPAKAHLEHGDGLIE